MVSNDRDDAYVRRSRKARGFRLGDLPIWFVVALIAALPLHVVAWGWFLSHGITLIRSLSASMVSSPEWLTGILYFPVGLVVVALTEFVAVSPLNLVVVIFGIRQSQVLKGAKHSVSYRSGPLAH